MRPTSKIDGSRPKPKRSPGIRWPKLIPGILLKRYKRFLADVQLQTGEHVTAHCPNSGTMKTCSDPGMPVYLSYHDNPKRKLKYTWELIAMPTSLVGVNTNVPNRLVAQSIRDGIVPELDGYDKVIPEIAVGNHSRLDLLLSNGAGNACYVEVKNCTLVADGLACFPDAVTARGKKHLVEMQALAKQGNRCVMFFLVQRMDAVRFEPADHIDPAYGRELRDAVRKRVEILVYDTDINLKRIALRKKIPFHL